MKKDNKQRLFEMMGKLDTSFKVRLNEYDYSDSNSYADYVDELKEFVNAVEDKDFNKAKRMLLNFENEGKMGGLNLYLSEYGEYNVKNWVSQSAKRKNKAISQHMNETNEDDLVDFEIPSWAVSALINGEYDGLEDEDISKLKRFTQDVVNRFGNANFISGDMDGEDNLGFKHSNDIDNLGSDVYRLYIMK